MGFRLGPDGKPQEVETSYATDQSEKTSSRKVEPSKPVAEPATQPPKVDLFDHLNKAKQSFDEPETAPVQDKVTPKPQPSKVEADPKTSIAMGSVGEEAADYVCGWFVIIDGPGKGKSINIGPGQSSVSRSPSERITINFGDTSITSKQQLVVIFDDEMREFIIAPGNGSSLNRLNGQIIAGQAVIKTGDLIKLGSTTVRFVSFCDQDFTWS